MHLFQPGLRPRSLALHPIAKMYPQLAYLTIGTRGEAAAGAPQSLLRIRTGGERLTRLHVVSFSESHPMKVTPLGFQPGSKKIPVLYGHFCYTPGWVLQLCFVLSATAEDYRRIFYKHFYCIVAVRKPEKLNLLGWVAEL